MSRIGLAVMLGIVSGCNGPETVFIDLVPILSVSPEVLDIGDVGLLYSGSGAIYVRNVGKDDLEVTPSFEGSDTFTLDLVEPFTVAADEETVLTVTFTPQTYQEYIGKVILESNDEEHPRWVIPVSGAGVDLPTPDIDITPSRTVEVTLDQGEYSALFGFDIVNLGDAPLQLGTLSMEGDSEFSPLSVPFEQIVAPNSSVQAIFEYYTTTTDGHNTTITIPSNDPDEPEITVLLLGNGGGEYDKPEAIIDCPPEVLLAGPESVHISGASSTDPAGALPLEYKWEVLSRPPAADEDIELDPDTTEAIDLYVDVAGEWSVQLVVTNQLGTESEPTVCTFSAYPEDDIHIELSWDTPSADLDLHLTQGGSDMFDVPEDCNYCNKTPDWGDNGTDDDPRLDIDDIGGFGPENINVYTPEVGTYNVRVHYFSEHGDDIVLATVTVWLEGVEVFTGTQALAFNEVWEVGLADFTTVDFFPDGLVATAAVRSCPVD